MMERSWHPAFRPNRDDLLKAEDLDKDAIAQTQSGALEQEIQDIADSQVKQALDGDVEALDADEPQPSASRIIGISQLHPEPAEQTESLSFDLGATTNDGMRIETGAHVPDNLRRSEETTQDWIGIETVAHMSDNPLRSEKVKQDIVDPDFVQPAQTLLSPEAYFAELNSLMSVQVRLPNLTLEQPLNVIDPETKEDAKSVERYTNDERSEDVKPREWRTDDECSQDFKSMEWLEDASSGEPHEAKRFEPPEGHALTDLWSSAFADDDFLPDEDATGFFDNAGEILPSKDLTEPPNGGNAVDPTTFFEDDGEGFLEPEINAVPAPVPPQLMPQESSGSYFASSASASIRPPLGPPNPSFVDQAKSGYSSPYDFPDDVVQNRRRASVRPALSQHQSTFPMQQQPEPPQRSTSTFPATASPVSSAPSAPSASRSTAPQNFFEDLGAIPARPKVRSRESYAPQSVLSPMLPSPPSHQPPTNAPVPNPYAPTATPYASVPTAASLNRPSSVAHKTPPNHYAATPSQQFARSPGQTTYIPERTDAPSIERAQMHPNHFGPPIPSTYAAGSAGSSPPSSSLPPALSQGTPTNELLVQQPNITSIFPSSNQANVTKSNYAPIGHGNSISRYVSPGSVVGHEYQPRTSSPLAQYSPASTNRAKNDTVPTSTYARHTPRGSGSNLYEPRSFTATPPQDSFSMRSLDEALPNTHESSPARRKSYAPSQSSPAQKQSIMPSVGTSPALPFMAPCDGTQLDPLERWKGCAFVSFGFGGLVVRHFPQRTPRFSPDGSASLQCSSGEVQALRQPQLALDNMAAEFPGPLKGKNKKKDLIEWMQLKIKSLEEQRSERLLLWKVMLILVEQDGVIRGQQKAETAIKSVLGVEDMQAESMPTFETDTTNPRPSDFAGQIRQLLLGGQREKAVWYAADMKQWSHAMILASTLNKTVLQQVSQEFVRQEVRPMNGGNSAMSAVYQNFAANWEEIADELVPLSLRTGQQMISMSNSAQPSSNIEDRLAQWRETLVLMLGNRTDGDEPAFMALAKLLTTYGKIDSAHLCSVLASDLSFLSSESPEPILSLLGAAQASDYSRDIDCLLLSEIFEFVRIILGPSQTIAAPAHLQSIKIFHAELLGNAGKSAEGQQYCESVLGIMKSKTRSSPFYHSLLSRRIDELQDRMRQSSRGEGDKWISRPSMDKVSGSIWAKFNSYVSGDDDIVSAANPQSLAETAGPFSRVNGESPTMSRATSFQNLHNAYQPSTAPSRYAPASVTRPQTCVNGFEPHDGPAYADLPDRSRTSHSFVRPYQDEVAPPSQQDSYMGQSYGPDSFDPTSRTGSLGDMARIPLRRSTTQPAFAVYKSQTPSFGPYSEIDTTDNRAEFPQESGGSSPYDKGNLSQHSSQNHSGQYSPQEEEKHPAPEPTKEEKKAVEKDNGGKRSWFGPWFNKNAANTTDPNKPVKVKLGEANSFVFDEKLKKWVNKKAGAAEEEQQAMPPPPPPKAPMARSVSAHASIQGSVPSTVPAVPPLPSHNGAEIVAARAVSGPNFSPRLAADEKTSLSDISPSMSPASVGGQISRPGTSQSSSSNIDELLGVPPPRPAGTVRKSKKARGYVDVMAK